jgi:hypothetical protein
MAATGVEENRSRWLSKKNVRLMAKVGITEG